MATIKPYEIPLRTTTVLIGMIGITTNGLSLCYFIRKQYNGLGNRLLMLLNICDLVVCFTALTSSILIHSKSSGGVTLYLTSSFIYMVFIDCTGFSTCLISVTRTIKVCRPFFPIRGVWIGASFLVYFFGSFSREFVCYYLYFIQPLRDRRIISKYYPMIFSSGTTLSVVAVFISTIITTHWLLRKNKIRGEVSQTNKHATKTILILSTTFCTINLIFVTAALTSFCVKMGVIKIDEPVMETYKDIVESLTISLNSAVNPLIYLSRKKEMRQYFKERAREVLDYFRNNESTEALSLQVASSRVNGSNYLPQEEMTDSFQ